MFNLGELFVAFTGKDMGLDSIMAKAHRQSEALQGQYLKLMGAGSSLGTAGQAAFFKIAYAAQAAWAATTMGLSLLVNLVTKLGSLTGSAIGAAGSMQEVKGKFDVVFKDSAPKVTQELDRMAAAMGRSKAQMYEMAANTQDLLVPLGFARDKAAGMSTKIAQLAVDMASFGNKSDADAINDIQAAMTGSGEVMKKYGIVLNETGLKAELLKMGIKGGADSASEQQKALARLNIIIRGSSDAHGDAVRTGGSFANQMKRIMGIVQDLGIKIGMVFVPALEVFQKFFGDGLVYIDQNTSFLEEWGQTLKGWAEVVVGWMRVLGVVFMNFGTITQLTVNLVKGMAADSGGVFFTLLENLWEAVYTFGVNWFQFWPNLGNAVMEVHGSIWGFLKKGWKEIWAFIKSGGSDAINLDFDKIILNMAQKMKRPTFKAIQAPETTKAWVDLVSFIDGKMKEADKKAEALPDIKEFDKSLAGDAGTAKKIKFELVAASSYFTKNLQSAFGDKEGEKMEIMKKTATAAESTAKTADKQLEETIKVRAALEKPRPILT